MASGLKVPDRDEQKEERRDGGDEAVNTNLANKAELKVHEVHRGSGAYSGVENRAKTQAARQRIESESRCQCEHVQVVDKAEIRHRHAEDTRIRAVNDSIASIDDRTPQRLASVVPSSNIDRDGYTDECEHEHPVRREGGLSTPGYFNCFLRRVFHCPNGDGLTKARLDVDQILPLILREQARGRAGEPASASWRAGASTWSRCGSLRAIIRVGSLRSSPR